jgi:hypothetical protein
VYLLEWRVHLVLEETLEDTEGDALRPEIWGRQDYDELLELDGEKAHSDAEERGHGPEGILQYVVAAHGRVHDRER